ncbi:hypothetical protein DZC31_30110 (plasmid) [Stenotrophomonas rhizophila]|nr:hypothetical protein DZC31_30110 [Stenotrophomonas rhizophila]
MLALVEVPGYGQAVAGLDWLPLPGLDGKSTEIKQLGRGVEAAWQFVWSVKGHEDEYVAFVSKGDVKQRPVAASALVRAAVAEDHYLALVDIGEDRLWLFAVKDGMPVSRMDRVGEAVDLMGLVRDFLTTLPESTQAPIYTDKPELLERLPYALDIRPFSLEILAHSFKKRDFSKAAFSRHSSAPIGAIAICAAAVLLGAGYYVYQVEAEAKAMRDAALIREREIAQRKLELANAVSSAINAGAPARIAVRAYLETTGRLEQVLAGWKLTEIECSGPGCMLIFKAQSFATWAGYLKAKPAEWPTPIFDSDINKVTQPIAVEVPSFLPRSAEALPHREQVRMELGNLAQTSKPLEVTMSLPSAWARVAGNPAEALPAEQWVPVAGQYDVNGSAALLQDLAMRLPEVADVTTLTFKLDGKLTFELKGKAYANP